MTNELCSHESCDNKFGALTYHRYTCTACEKDFCDDHACNSSYLEHLAGVGESVNKAVSENGYLCYDCFLQNLSPEQLEEEEKTRAWLKNIWDRKCHHAKCSASLHSGGTFKRSCKICGHWFCSGDTVSADKIPKSDLDAKAEYPQAEAVCKKCASPLVSTGILDSLASGATGALSSNIEQKTLDTIAVVKKEAIEITREVMNESQEFVKRSILIIALRGALAAISCAAVVLIAPNLREVADADNYRSFSFFWYLLTVTAALIILMVNVVRPALKEKETRIEAFIFILVCVLTLIGYLISLNTAH